MTHVDLEKAAAASQHDAASNRSRRLTASSSDSGLRKAKEQGAGNKADEHNRVGRSRRPSSHDDEDEDEDEDSDVDAIPGVHVDRQLSRQRSSPQYLERTETRNSTRSRASNVLTSITSRIRRNHDTLVHEPIPESNLAEGLVAWDSQTDPEMPLNWPERRKWLQVATISIITLLTPFTSSALAPGIQNMMHDFGVTNPVVGSLTVSIYLMGYCIGPLALAPLSEMYGKKVVLDVSNVMFCLWQIGCALAPNVGALIVFRFLAGVGGSGCLTLGGGSIGDMFHPEQRGMATGFWTLGPLLGPSLGPLVGGFLASSIGWRWTFWITLIAGAFITTTIIFYNKETNYTVLIDRKIARMQKEQHRSAAASATNVSSQQTPSITATTIPELRNHYQPHKATKSALLKRNLVRPMKLLFLSPIVSLLSLYLAFLYGTLYLLFTTIPTIFKSTYHFSTGETGLVYLALGFGNLIGWSIITFSSDKQVVKMTRANNNIFVPEMRLFISLWFSALIPITFFWYGWTAQYEIHWACAVFALVPFGIGLIGVFLPVTTFLVDCYPTYAASAIAANTTFRSLVGAFLPLAGPSMYASLGLGWGNTLLGFLCFAMIPIPMLFHKFGARLRAGEKFTL